MVHCHTFSVILLCIVLSYCGSAAVGKSPPRVKSKLPTVGQLQAQGHSYLLRKEYQSASYCYSAILQLVQGSLNDRQLQSRRHCGLQLAQCELKLGNEMKAIARCCEVIEESPEVLPSFDETQSYVLRDEAEQKTLSASERLAHDLGRAHFLRGQCLSRIGQPRLALQDFEAALRYLPDEIQVHDEIAGLEKAKEDEETKKSASPAVSQEDSSREGASEEPSEPQESSTTEEGADLFEECVLQHPSLVFTPKQLRKLGRKSQASVTVRPLHPNTPSGVQPFPPGPSLDFSSLLGFGSPLMGAEGSSNNNKGGLSGVGGVSGALDKLIAFVPMLCSLGGMPPATSKAIVDALTLLLKIVAGVQRGYAAARTYSDVIVVALGVVWLAATVQSYRRL